MINLDNLSEKEQKELLKQLEEKRQAQEEAKQERREEYKKLVAEVTTRNYKKLQDVSEFLTIIKTEIFNDFITILELKEELYDVKENQQSHTFTVGDIGICLGRRTIDSYDDTVHAGIAKVKKYITSLTEGQGKDIEKILELLLKKDKNGNLKANRVLELEKIAKDINSDDLKDGVKIIKEAYKPTQTAYFIEGLYKDETGARRSLPLSLSSVRMGEGYEGNREGTN